MKTIIYNLLHHKKGTIWDAGLNETEIVTPTGKILLLDGQIPGHSA